MGSACGSCAPLSSAELLVQGLGCPPAADVRARSCGGRDSARLAWRNRDELQRGPPPRAVGLCGCPRMLRCHGLQLCKATSELLQDAPSWGALSRKPQTFSCPAPPHVLAVEAAKWPVPGKHRRRCGIRWREGSYWGRVLAGWSGLLLGTGTGAGDSRNPCVGRGALAGAGKGCGAAVDCFLLGSP